MEFTAEQAVERIKTPSNRNNIQAARAQESQLRVFTEELDEVELNDEPYFKAMKTKIKSRSAKKADRVFEFMRYPLPTSQICDSILSEFFKVFDGKNRNFHIDADRDITVLKKWIEDSELEKWIEQQAKKVFKSMPCSFIVIDKDQSGKPYKILVDSDRLIDVQLTNAMGQCEYIAFVHSYIKDGKRIAFYDDKSYFVFEKMDSSDTYTVITEQKHNIGYCPARTFISEPANSKNILKRRVAFSAALSKLEDWTIFDVFRNYTDHYVPFPVTEAPKRKCPNDDCEDGFVTETLPIDPKYPDVAPAVKQYKCEVCDGGNINLIMPGTHIGIKVAEESSQKDGSGVFKMHFPDKDAMSYVPEKLDDLELEIRHKTVGLNFMTSTNEAMNEMQLKGSFASMESVLMRTKQELDIVYVWIVKTAAFLFYKDLKIKVDANFGTEFYLVTEDDLQKRFKEAKAAGLPQDEQLMLYEQLIETKYKGNPNKVNRQKMLIKLDSLPLMSVTDAMTLRASNVIDADTLSMKINFLNFITKFETENGPITQFGLLLAPEKRIEKIKDVLFRYNTETMAKITPIKAPEPAPQQ